MAKWMCQIGVFPASQLAALEETTSAVRRLLAVRVQRAFHLVSSVLLPLR